MARKLTKREKELKEKWGWLPINIPFDPPKSRPIQIALLIEIILAIGCFIGTLILTMLQ